jgi:2-polyprenyl-3-methyl-5-hydroxy-6-metoxy-1,4-benzoquinol methylase
MQSSRGRHRPTANSGLATSGSSRPTCWRTIAAAPGACQAADDADDQHRHAPITLFCAPMMAIRQTRTGAHSGGTALTGDGASRTLAHGHLSPGTDLVKVVCDLGCPSQVVHAARRRDLTTCEHVIGRRQLIAVPRLRNQAVLHVRAGIGSGYVAAGIVPGARIADVGCGPDALLRLLAERVGAEGRAVGIDADPAAVAMARQQIAGLPQARVQLGQADATGLEPGGYDVIMCRHVLAHNGGREAAIVAHLASLAAAGGCVYLVDVDATALRFTASEPDLEDLHERYREFHRARGNDLSVGLRLGDLLTEAGLTVERYACRAPVLRVPPGVRPPSWAARGPGPLPGGWADGDGMNRQAGACAIAPDGRAEPAGQRPP